VPRLAHRKERDDMSDLVFRLQASDMRTSAADAALMREAANEITYLRAQISDIQRLCDEYAESEEKGLMPRGQHFVSWVRQALAVPR
jgi:hexokinase